MGYIGRERLQWCEGKDSFPEVETGSIKDMKGEVNKKIGEEEEEKRKG